jgi:hypothetical protein
MTISRLAEIWRTISADLGLEMEAPYQIHFTDGAVIDADLLLKNFGGDKGMLLFDDYSKIEDYTQPIIDAGYGFSVLPRYSKSYVYDAEIIMDMLAEWTWTGPVEEKPTWLVGREDDEE